MVGRSVECAGLGDVLAEGTCRGGGGVGGLGEVMIADVLVLVLNKDPLTIKRMLTLGIHLPGHIFLCQGL